MKRDGIRSYGVARPRLVHIIQKSVKSGDGEYLCWFPSSEYRILSDDLGVLQSDEPLRVKRSLFFSDRGSRTVNAYRVYVGFAKWWLYTLDEIYEHRKTNGEIRTQTGFLFNPKELMPQST